MSLGCGPPRGGERRWEREWDKRGRVGWGREVRRRKASEPNWASRPPARALIPHETHLQPLACRFTAPFSLPPLYPPIPSQPKLSRLKGDWARVRDGIHGQLPQSPWGEHLLGKFTLLQFGARAERYLAELV